MDLSIPIIKTGKKIAISEARFEPKGNWLKDHRRGIMSAYGNTPFFEHYEEQIMNCLVPRTDNLLDHNMQILSVCLNIIGAETAIGLTNDFHKKYEKSEYLDLRNIIHPKKALPEGLQVVDIAYSQAFGNVFAPGLSILDLLFNEGPNAISVLAAMTSKS